MSSQRKVYFRSDDPQGGLTAEYYKNPRNKISDYSGSDHDRRDMYRLGKRQQLDVSPSKVQLCLAIRIAPNYPTVLCSLLKGDQKHLSKVQKH